MVQRKRKRTQALYDDDQVRIVQHDAEQRLRSLPDEQIDNARALLMAQVRACDAVLRERWQAVKREKVRKAIDFDYDVEAMFVSARRRNSANHKTYLPKAKIHLFKTKGE